MRKHDGIIGIGACMIVFAIVANAAILAGAVWIVVKVLQMTGVL